MKIVRSGKFYEVIDNMKVMFKGGSYESARNYLAINGNDDAVGDLSRGRVDLFGEYDLEGKSRIHFEQKEIRRTFQRSLIDSNRREGPKCKSDALKELSEIVGE